MMVRSKNSHITGREDINNGPQAVRYLARIGGSQTYNEAKDYNKSEMTALELVLRNPSNMHYKMHYLKVIQMSRTKDYAMKDLNKAKTAFPENPDIRLALARGCASKEDRRHDAIQLYKEFSQKAPVNHPHKNKAERALDIIR